MNNLAPSKGESALPSNGADGPVRHTLRTVSILLVTLLLLAGGGWWMNQAGLLGLWLPPTAQTASSVAAGVQAQGDSEPQGTPPAGSLTNDRAPGQGPDGQVDTVSGEASATAAPGAAATPKPEVSTASVTSASMMTVPGVAGVRGSRLYDERGVLLASLDSGDSLLITGRSDDSAWLVVSAANERGWAPANELIAYGLQRLPVLELPAAVTAAATVEATGVANSLSLTVATSTSSSALATLPVTEAVTLALQEAAADQRMAVTATVVIEEGRLNLRTGPGTAYTIIGKSENGTAYTVLGRNEAGDWLQLELEDSEAGWASASYLDVAGVVEDLPVIQGEVTPSVQAGAPLPVANTAAAAGSDIILASAVSTTGGSADGASAGGALAGTLVFQQSPGGMIYGYNLETGDLWSLTNGFDPAISPDGSTVVFVRDGGETGLYLIDIGGGNERRIFERPALSSPKWSTDGQWIIFTRNDEGVECYLINDRQCMLPDEFNKRFPMGAPSEIPLVTEYQYKLAAVDANGGSYHDVASLNSARAADWGDAGIVYQSSAGIQITGDDEGATTQTVTFDNLNPYFYDPDLQPGGGQIVFQRKGAAQTDLWVVNTDGSGLHALTQAKTTLVDTLPSNVSAAYSPDGQSVVFLSNRTEGGEAGDWHLWVMNADGSNQRQLPIDLTIDYTYGSDQVVSWGA